MTYEQHIANIRKLQQQLQDAHEAMAADDYLDSSEFYTSHNAPVGGLLNCVYRLDEWLYDKEQEIKDDAALSEPLPEL
jgi:hypothetical protein